MKKKIDISQVASSLRGESVFFPTKKDALTSEEEGEPITHARTEETLPSSPIDPAKETPTDTMIPRYHDTNVDTTIPSNRDTMIPETEEEMLEAVRKAVKQIGKEPATQRLTLEEKKVLKAIEFTYGQQGIITSGNEIIRIGMNYALKDYQKNGENSILAKVLKRLNF